MSQPNPESEGGRHERYEGPVKVRVEAAQAPTLQPGNVPAEINVIAAKPGTVGFLDKAKAYYHTIIVVLGGILAASAEWTPALDAYPTVKPVVLSVLGALTLVLLVLKSNETWVQKP